MVTVPSSFQIKQLLCGVPVGEVSGWSVRGLYPKALLLPGASKVESSLLCEVEGWHVVLHNERRFCEVRVSQYLLRLLFVGMHWQNPSATFSLSPAMNTFETLCA